MPRVIGAFDSAQRLLTALADGKVHSGQTLADRAGVSRAAVWKAVETLRRQGHDIEAVPGRGYQMIAPYEGFSPARIRAQLVPGLPRMALQVYREIDSTSASLRREPPEADRVSVAVAERQTRGRGRLGRGWASPPGGIYLSVSWPYEHLERGPGGLTLAVGVCLAEAIRAMGVADAAVKWPNDLWVGGRKLAGILTELEGDPNGRCRVIVGVGLNWHSPAGGRGLDQAVIGLAELLPDADRNHAAAVVINAVCEACRAVPQGLAGVLGQRWRAVDLLRGRGVIVELSERCIEGRALGIDEAGALLVETSAGRERLFSGDVRVRPQ